MAKNEKSTPANENSAPSFYPDALDKSVFERGVGEKVSTLRILLQEGKPFRKYWLQPTQRNLQEAAADLAIRLCALGKSERVASHFNLLGIANSSAFGKFMDAHFPRPEGEVKESPTSVSVEDLHDL